MATTLNDIAYQIQEANGLVGIPDMVYGYEEAISRSMNQFGHRLLDKVYETIKHGDEEHMKWLKDKCEELKKEL